MAPFEGAVDLGEARRAQPAELEVERREDVRAGPSERGIEIARVDAGRPNRVDPILKERNLGDGLAREQERVL